MATVVPVVGGVLEALREVFCDEDKPPLGGVTNQPEHRPGGDVALDGLWNDNCRGLVFANVLRMYRSREFPGEQPDVSLCSGPLTAVIQVGAARCVSTVDDMGRAPDPEDMEHDALVGLDDARRLEVAACRAMRRAEKDGVIHQWTTTGLDPIGPAGGALAWVLTVTVQIA